MKPRFLVPASALLIAGSASGLTYTGGANQFAGGFSPSNVPNGGFGGGGCTAIHTPIVFLHGNGDEAKNWDYPSSTGVASVYDEFKAAGYNDCELFGLTWLSSSERGAPQLNYHSPTKAAARARSSFRCAPDITIRSPVPPPRTTRVAATRRNSTAIRTSKPS